MRNVKLLAFLFLVFFIIILFWIHSKVTEAYGEEAIIHNGNESYYYQNLEHQDTIVLPNNEIVDTDDLKNIEENDSALRTREGLEIYKMYDDHYYLEKSCYEGDTSCYEN